MAGGQVSKYFSSWTMSYLYQEGKKKQYFPIMKTCHSSLSFFSSNDVSWIEVLHCLLRSVGLLDFFPFRYSP